MMKDYSIFIEKQFNFWVVKEILPAEKYDYNHFVMALCTNCNSYKKTRLSALTSGQSKSCGCIKFPNLIDERFTKLKVLERIEKTPERSACWKCVCDCGNITYVSTSYLKTGHTRSCGCLLSDVLRKRNERHGYKANGSKYYNIYTRWTSMKQRCGKGGAYENLGITIYPEWLAEGRKGVDAFINYCVDVLEVDLDEIKHLTLDRIDPKGNYEPGNIRFTTVTEQQRNKINTKRYSYKGGNYCAMELYENFSPKDISFSTFQTRLKEEGIGDSIFRRKNSRYIKEKVNA